MVGELRELGVDVAKSTVEKYRVPVRGVRTGPRAGCPEPTYGVGGNAVIMRFQLKGPKLLAPARPSLSPGLTTSLTYSKGATLPCTTMRWKFFTL
jgi:hypothetical protein